MKDNLYKYDALIKSVSYKKRLRYTEFDIKHLGYRIKIDKEMHTEDLAIYLDKTLEEANSLVEQLLDKNDYRESTFKKYAIGETDSKKSEIKKIYWLSEDSCIRFLATLNKINN